MNGYEHLWNQTWDAYKSLQFTEAIQALRIIAKHDPRHAKSAREQMQVAVSRRNAYLHDPEPQVDYMPPDLLDGMIPMCRSDVWYWKAYEDPLAGIKDPRDTALEVFLDEWSREITEGRDNLRFDPLSKTVEHKWFAKGWPEL